MRNLLSSHWIGPIFAAAILVAVLATSLLADSSERDIGKTDEILMQGTWKLVTFESRQKGQLYTPMQFSGRRVVEGNKYTLRLNLDGREQGGVYSFTLFQDKRPRQFDVVMPNGQTVKGIYRIKDETLERAYSQPDAPRPTAFRAEDQHYQIWRRVLEKED